MLSVSLSQYNDPVHLGRSGMQRHMPYELHQKQPTTTASTTNHVLCSKSTTLQTMFQDTSWVILPFPGIYNAYTLVAYASRCLSVT